MTMKNNSVLMETFEKWLPLAIAIVVMAGLVYVAVQQNYRQSANDPQIQIAQDVAAALSAGQAAPGSVVPPNPTAEMSPSLSTFVAVFSATGTPIGSSAALDGKLPVLPAGVLDAAKQRGENRFTWQPKTGARFAVDVAYFSGKEDGFVLAGRSLKEVEVRESQLTLMSLIATVLALVLTFGAEYCLAMKKQKKTVPVGQSESPEPAEVKQA